MTDTAGPFIRVAAYNILNGGLGRLDPIAETLLVINADVTALIEANDPNGVAYLAKRTGCEWVMAESPDSPFHVAMLSRHPIQRMVNLGVKHRGISRAAMSATLEIDHQPLRVGVVHLQPGLGSECEQVRMREMSQLLPHWSNGQTPTVIMGDLNTNAAWHPVEVAAAEPGVRKRIEADPTVIRHEVIEQLEGRGWVEAYRRCRPEEPVHTFSTGFPSTRLDYVFADAVMAQRLVDAGVERRGFAPYCSDHYPIWADFRPSARR